MNRIKVVQIARCCHEANKALCESLGDYSQSSWALAEQWQRDSAIAGVEFYLVNPTTTAAKQHEAWMQDKLNNGWIYGPVKDSKLKTHPCLVPYEKLPREQQNKDKLFRAICKALSTKA